MCVHGCFASVMFKTSVNVKIGLRFKIMVKNLKKNVPSRDGQ